MKFRLPALSHQHELANFALLMAIGLWAVLAVAMLFVMSLGTDEAWVLNGLRSTLRPVMPGLTTEIISTSGGVFAIANLLVEWVAGSQVWLHRLVSLFFLLLAVVTIVRVARSADSPRWELGLLAVPMLALPGTVEVGTAALGTSTGLFLMVASLVVWTDASKSTRRRVIQAGVLYGLAAASRFDLVLVGGALLLCGTLRVSQKDGIELRFDGPAWSAVSVGLAIFLANFWIMNLPANSVAQDDLANATGLAAWSFNYPKLLNQWATLGSFVPVGLLALLSASVFLPPRSQGSDVPRVPVPRLESLLLASGIILMAGWLLRAPIPHLRYVWPALFCFGALGSIGLGRLLRRLRAEGNGKALLWVQCMGVVVMATSLVSGLRSLVVADSDIISWEWSNEAPLDYFRRFAARAEQQQVAQFLNTGLPAEARIHAWLPYALRYLSERPVVDLQSPAIASDSQHRDERYLVMTPTVGAYLHLDTEAGDWIAANAILVAQFGRYSVYRLPAGSGAEMQVLRLARTNYLGHPGSQRWFGRESLKP